MGGSGKKKDMRDPGQLVIDPGQVLRYSAETQDQAYRSGAYDFVEPRTKMPERLRSAALTSRRERQMGNMG